MFGTDCLRASKEKTRGGNFDSQVQKRMFARKKENCSLCMKIAVCVQTKKGKHKKENGQVGFNLSAESGQQ